MAKFLDPCSLSGLLGTAGEYNKDTGRTEEKMKVELHSLVELRQCAAAITKEAFVGDYPGVFLVAMGLLSSQPLGGKGSGTLALAFGDRLRHEVQSHPLAGLAFFLRSSRDPHPILLGRTAGCDLTIPDPSVSEQHCRIQIAERGVEAVDLSSTNGTSINLTRLTAGEPAVLGDEDILTLGRYSFQVLSSATCHAALRLLETMARLGE